MQILYIWLVRAQINYTLWCDERGDYLRAFDLIKVIDDEMPIWINYLDIDKAEYYPNSNEDNFSLNTLHCEVVSVTQDSDNVLTIEVRF